MKKGQLQIHSQNILPIIKKWLYSEKDIFLRELVSNACDALLKRSILQENEIDPARIDITTDKTGRTLTISDTGIGMLGEETEKYLAQIAFSGAEEFIKAYQTNDAFIGHFGLGFYSAYMVADSVQVRTLSYNREATAVLWSCDGSSEYELQEDARSAVGTDIILHINQENEEFLEEPRLLELLKRFCLFLPYPIYLNGTLINSKEPLWLKTPSSCSKQEYIDFYKLLYPFEEEPLFWVHLNVDYPFHVKGILYFPRMKKEIDLQKNHVKLFSNRVFVSEDCKDILPDYLTILKGTIDSPDIPLNVSRSYLQVDKTVKGLSHHISKKVVDTLFTLYKTDRDRFYEVWADCELIIKLGLLNDDKFAKTAKEFLVWKTTKGAWTQTSEYIENNKSKASDSIFYVNEEQAASPLLDLYEKQGIDVLIAKAPLDSAVMSLLEKELSPVQFKRIDGHTTESIIDSSKEKTLLDADGRTESAKIADFVRSSIAPGIDVEAKSLAASSITGFISMKEEERRLRDYLARISAESPKESFAKATFVVNTNSPVITSLYQMKDHQPELAKMMAQQIVDLALLSQKEMDTSQLKEFVARSNSLLEKVAQTLPTETKVHS
ncbi:MAG: molecular chaperone HtpG [Verrucomicrobia bacterium]|nr:molecular chaperone HtpG [Verrucomicrobiota bacterium]